MSCHAEDGVNSDVALSCPETAQILARQYYPMGRHVHVSREELRQKAEEDASKRQKGGTGVP